MRLLDFRNAKWLNNPYNRCDECGKAVIALVAFGDYDYEWDICGDCLRVALKMAMSCEFGEEKP